ncbi:hypothetical protein D0962_21305 [Leptolyngbyaceae cyanobacterium CCMR0082]|uniref:Uncharacterized protein n=1 Tax=Adonisia turfae CCMR0082 TaxID=2304604 RepID=A0A6M0S9V2_9CYAN|nr:hypothetical protein [Adonisia turfae]NEZ65277.1 hypothetical protein [Adonisia turfae CCMR0082]
MKENALSKQVQEAINAGTLAKFMRENLEGKNLSIAGVAALCSVADKSIINGGSFNSAALAEKLENKGFDAGSLVEEGFNSVATWLTIEYFAYESKAKAVFAKAIARTFGAFGVKAAFDEVLGVAPNVRQLPRRSISEIDEFATVLGKRFGPHVEESCLILNLRRHYPDMEVPEISAEQRTSLPLPEALMRPTDIGEKLGILFKTGRGNAAKVNTLLKELGYQVKSDGSPPWTPTEKGKPFCELKPIDTGSKSDKFQLLWRVSIIDELRDQNEGGVAA